MKLIFRTLIVLFLPFLTISTADISNTKGLGQDVDFQDFVDIKDETTTLQFDFDREFYFSSFYTQLLTESSYSCNLIRPEIQISCQI